MRAHKKSYAQFAHKKTQHPLLALWPVPAYLGVSKSKTPYI